MCGITGSVWTDPELQVAPQTLDAMTDVLRHRAELNDEQQDQFTDLIHQMVGSSFNGQGHGQ